MKSSCCDFKQVSGSSIPFTRQAWSFSKLSLLLVDDGLCLRSSCSGRVFSGSTLYRWRAPLSRTIFCSGPVLKTSLIPDLYNSWHLSKNKLSFCLTTLAVLCRGNVTSVDLCPDLPPLDSQLRRLFIVPLLFQPILAFTFVSLQSFGQFRLAKSHVQQARRIGRSVTASMEPPSLEYADSGAPFSQSQC